MFVTGLSLENLRSIELLHHGLWRQPKSALRFTHLAKGLPVKLGKNYPYKALNIARRAGLGPKRVAASPILPHALTF